MTSNHPDLDCLTQPKRWHIWQRLPVAVKMSFSIGSILLLGMLALAGAIHSYQSQLMEQQVNEFGDVIGGQLASSVVEPLFADRELDRELLLRNFVLSDQVVGAALYDHQGTLLTQVGELPATIQQQLLEFTASGLSSSNKDSSASVRFSHVQFRGVVGGYVAVVLTRDSIALAYRKALQAVGVILLLLMVCIVPVVIVMGRQVTRPIRRLVNVTASHKQASIQGDEIGQLANTFQIMDQGLLQKRAVERRLEQLLSRDVARKVINEIDSAWVEGEHVDATVMFADIVGFTSLSEQMRPQEVSDFLNEFFSYLSRCSQFFYGSVDKYIGDCIMVVFGAPVPDSHQHYNAVACALVMQQVIKEINWRRKQQGKAEVQLRIGINSGDMVAGMIGSPERMEYTVVGDAVNLASRFCSEAEAGEVIVPASLCDALAKERNIAVSDQREIRVRGKEHPLPVCRVTAMALDKQSMVDALIQDIITIGAFK